MHYEKKTLISSRELFLDAIYFQKVKMRYDLYLA